MNQQTTPGEVGKWLQASRPARVVELVLVFGGGFALIGLVRTVLGEGLVEAQISAVSGVAAMVLLTWLGLRLRGQGWAEYGLFFGRSSARGVASVVLKSIPTCIGAVLAFVLAGAALMSILGASGEADMSGYAFLKGRPLLLAATIVTVWLTASFSEEVLYRGFMLKRLEEIGGTPFAVLLSSVLFGLAHFTWGPVGMVQTFAMGLVLAIAFVKFGRNLWVTILAHAYMDTLLLLSVYAQLARS